jgi:hypothetical protein
MDQTETVFRYLTEKFPGIRAANITENVFIGPQIHKLFRDKQFNQTVSCNKRARNDFRLLATNFRGNNKADNYSECVENLLFSLTEIRLQYVSTYPFSTFSPGYFSGRL